VATALARVLRNRQQAVAPVMVWPQWVAQLMLAKPL